MKFCVYVQSCLQIVVRQTRTPLFLRLYQEGNPSMFRPTPDACTAFSLCTGERICGVPTHKNLTLIASSTNGYTNTSSAIHSCSCHSTQVREFASVNSLRITKCRSSSFGSSKISRNLVSRWTPNQRIRSLQSTGQIAQEERGRRKSCSEVISPCMPKEDCGLE